MTDFRSNTGTHYTGVIGPSTVQPVYPVYKSQPTIRASVQLIADLGQAFSTRKPGERVRITSDGEVKVEALSLRQRLAKRLVGNLLTRSFTVIDNKIKSTISDDNIRTFSKEEKALLIQSLEKMQHSAGVTMAYAVTTLMPLITKLGSEETPPKKEDSPKPKVSNPGLEMFAQILLEQVEKKYGKSVDLTAFVDKDGNRGVGF